MRLFVASIATETNTFSPVFVDRDAFEQAFYAPPGQHPKTPTLCSAVFNACREKVPEHGGELFEGTATWAEPAGIVNKYAWEQLRDEILLQLEQAMPLDAVVLGLHGAMVAQDYLDCEGDLLQRVRDIVGADAVITTTFDPHSHLTEQRLRHADIIVAFKEFPHTDFVDAAYKAVDLTLKTLDKKIKPTMSAFDCRMIDVLPTSREPMRSFIDKLNALEKTDPEVLSISIIHGFMAGDVPEMGTRILAMTNNNPEKAAKLAHELGMELFGFRGKTRHQYYEPANAIALAKTINATPIVIADVWDNPGGGVAGDSTILIQELLKQKCNNVAVGGLWDPIAVSFCKAAGVGASIKLRFGGKSSALAGNPIDAQVKINRIVGNAQQSFGDSLVNMGDSVAIEFDGIELILISNRCQVFSPDLFTNLGIDLNHKHMVVVKSTNHFYAAFAKISEHILYVDAGGPYPSNPKLNNYKNLIRPLWPIVENPFSNE